MITAVASFLFLLSNEIMRFFMYYLLYFFFLRFREKVKE